MEFIQFEKSNMDQVVSQAERIIRAGGTVVAPTDTVYGLLANAKDDGAVKKMFRIKKRSREKAFPVFVRDIAEARKLAYISDSKAKFLENIWPGPFTLVFYYKRKLSDFLTGDLATVGIRISKHPFIAGLLDRLEIPLAQSSANISDKPPVKNISELKQYFKDSQALPDLVIDDGDISSSVSTVIDFTRDKPIILRTGLISIKELDRILMSF